MRLFGAAAHQTNDAGKLKNAYGFDLDASVRVPACDRKRLEQLARYTLRPPLSRSRLERLPDGRYQIALKKPWNDGSTHI
jgi:predicted DNA-binding protein